MGNAKKQIAELHKKYRKEREVKKEVAGAAIRALRWWEATNQRIEGTVRGLFEEWGAVLERQLTFSEWMGVCPVYIVAARFKKAGAVLRGRMEKKRKEFDLWRVRVVLGGEKTLTGGEIANQLKLSTKRTLELLEEIAEEEGKKGGDVTHRAVVEASGD